MSDPLHELCFPHIDFHPTLVGGRRGRKKERQRKKEGETEPTANCLRDIVEVMKGQNVSEMRKEKKMKAPQKKKKAIKRF